VARTGSGVHGARPASGITARTLRDGTLLWKAQKPPPIGRPLLAASLAGQVLSSARRKKECRAHQSHDGPKLAERTGKPSGQGVASGGLGGIYYLPPADSSAGQQG